MGDRYTKGRLEGYSARGSDVPDGLRTESGRLRGDRVLAGILVVVYLHAQPHGRSVALRCCSWPRCARPRATSSPRLKNRSPLPRHVPCGRRRCRRQKKFACRCRHRAVELLGCRCSDDGGPGAASLRQVARAAVAGVQARCIRRFHRAVRGRARPLANGSAEGEAAGATRRFRVPMAHTVIRSRG